jgi:hypothetical protein
MNGHRPWLDRKCRLVDLPIIGSLLYRLNVSRLVIRYMAAGHVYTDAAWLHAERLSEKLAVTLSPDARFSSVRFVTGKLDPLTTRTEFLDTLRVGRHLIRAANKPKQKLANSTLIYVNRDNRPPLKIQTRRASVQGDDYDQLGHSRTGDCRRISCKLVRCQRRSAVWHHSDGDDVIADSLHRGGIGVLA